MDSQELDQRVEIFRRALLDLYDAVNEYATEATDAEDAARFLIKLTDAKSDFNWIHQELTAVVIRLFGNAPEMTVEGRLIEKKMGAARKHWNHEAIVKTIVDRLTQLSIDEDTGEVTITPEQAVRDILKYGHIDYWRVTDLRELDINADFYCDVEEGKPGLIVRKAK